MSLENHKNIIRNYIRAKDDNKPLLMEQVFTESATLEMEVKTDNISFPPDTVSLKAITDVLVKNFSQTYENVYTFCLSDSFNNNVNSIPNTVSCDWLVCMTERDGGNVRVGSGRYDWRFNEQGNKANHLIITIEKMLILVPAHTEKIFEWVKKLPYPFCDSEKMFEFILDLDVLDSIIKDNRSGNN